MATVEFEYKEFATKIAQALSENEFINRHCKGRVKLYEIEEVVEDGVNIIYIDPIIVPNDIAYGSNRPLSSEFIYQISVESKNYRLTKALQQECKKIMREKFDFLQIEGGLDEYFPERKKYVDARRYNGRSKLYDSDY